MNEYHPKPINIVTRLWTLEMDPLPCLDASCNSVVFMHLYFNQAVARSVPFSLLQGIVVSLRKVQTAADRNLLKQDSMRLLVAPLVAVINEKFVVVLA